MRNRLIPFAIVALATSFASAQQGALDPLLGRWDLTIKTPSDTYPSWIEVTSPNGETHVRIVGRVSSVHPATGLKRDGSKISFETSEWFGKPTKVNWILSASHGRLRGTQQREDGVTGRLSGVKAPLLNRTVTAWGKPEPLFDGKDLNGWSPLITEPGKSTANNWRAIKGEMVNTAPGANIRTLKTFTDFKLHVEFNCPPDGNSGVYLRGRYETQIEYEPTEKNDKLHGMGSIYGFLAPGADVAPTPSQWETLDITFVGRAVSIVRNGAATITDQEIPGITGGALDSAEGQPGPIYIQGDHTGGMKYRNITISQPQR